MSPDRRKGNIKTAIWSIGITVCLLLATIGVFAEATIPVVIKFAITSGLVFLYTLGLVLALMDWTME